MSKSDQPSKEIRHILKKIAPDLRLLLDLTGHDDDEDDAHGVVEDSIRSGAQSLLIAKRIIKENRK